MIVNRPKELRHLAPHELAALHDFVSHLRARFPESIRHVWLFGSMVRGDADAESDIDLLVVADDNNWQFQQEVDALAVDMNLHYGVVLSDHMMSADQYRRLQEWHEPIYADIRRDGVDLWMLDKHQAT